MWIDENGVTHTAWVPPEVILGAESVAALRAVSREVADAAIADLDGIAMSVYDEAEAGATPGPSDLEDLSAIDYPPEFPGLAPQNGEALSQTIRRYLSGVPPQWRVEAMEAVFDVLEPPDPDQD